MTDDADQDTRETAMTDDDLDTMSDNTPPPPPRRPRQTEDPARTARRVARARKKIIKAALAGEVEEIADEQLAMDDVEGERGLPASEAGRTSDDAITEAALAPRPEVTWDPQAEAAMTAIVFALACRRVLVTLTEDHADPEIKTELATAICALDLDRRAEVFGTCPEVVQALLHWRRLVGGDGPPTTREIARDLPTRTAIMAAGTKGLHPLTLEDLREGDDDIGIGGLETPQTAREGVLVLVYRLRMHAQMAAARWQAPISPAPPDGRQSCVTEMAERYSSPGATRPTISTRLPALDAAIGGGWTRGDGVLIAGPTGAGKTSLAMHAAADFCRAGHEVAYVALDMASCDKVFRRWLAHVTGTPMGDLRQGPIPPAIIARAEALGWAHRIKIIAPGERTAAGILTTLDIRAPRARLIIIDDILGVAPAREDRRKDQWQQLGSAARALVHGGGDGATMMILAKAKADGELAYAQGLIETMDLALMWNRKISPMDGSITIKFLKSRWTAPQKPVKLQFDAAGDWHDVTGTAPPKAPTTATAPPSAPGKAKVPTRTATAPTALTDATLGRDLARITHALGGDASSGEILARVTAHPSRYPALEAWIAKREIVIKVQLTARLLRHAGMVERLATAGYRIRMTQAAVPGARESSAARFTCRRTAR